MKPRIAWVTYDLPYPPVSGGKLRAYHLIKRLSQNFEIDLYSFYRREEQLTNLNELKKYCGEVRTYRRTYVWSPINLFMALFSRLPLLGVSYLNKNLERDLLGAVKEGRYGAVHFEFLGVAGLLPKVKNLGTKTVFGTENIESHIYERYTQKHRASVLYPLFRLDVSKMKRWEEDLWRKADVVLAVSEADAKVIEGITGYAAAIVRNGVEIPIPGPQSSKSGRVNGKPPVAFFAGDLNYQQNRSGLAWFLGEVLPRIKELVPEFKVLVLSGVRPSFINKYQRDVIVEVDRRAPFEDFVERCSIFISPITIKSGTNIKVLQAAACGLPIVGTSLSFTGYDFIDGKDVLVADEPDQFAKSVARLFLEKGVAEVLAARAFEKVGKYSWEISAKILKDAYFKVLS